jgi:hypothetical protein
MSRPASAVRAEHTYPTILKVPRELRLCPNLADYDRTCHRFTWDSAGLMLEGLPGGRGLNIAHEAVDRHAAGPLSNHLALRWIGKSSTIWDFTYATLQGDQPVRQRPQESRGCQGRPGVCAHGPHPRALRRRAGVAEEPLRVLAPVLGLRTGADSCAPEPRRGQSARDHREGAFSNAKCCRDSKPGAGNCRIDP